MEILAAQQTFENVNWYEGTADAVRKHIRYIEQPGVEYVLILSGDQLYRMNYAEMIKTHQESKADVTIGAVPVSTEQAKDFGIMRLDDSGRVVGFLEKPKTLEELKIVRTDPAWIDARWIPSRGREALASMGIYVFKKDALLDVLTKTDYQDFGKEIFPASIRTKHVQVHMFDSYWEDIGTIKAFYQANLDLTKEQAPFQLTSPTAPIYSRPRFLAPTRFDGVTVKQSLIADGCTIGKGTVIENSVIGLRFNIGSNVTIRNSVLMGADFFQTPEDIQAHANRGEPPIGVGDGSVIEGAIVDKNCRIGRNVRVVNRSGVDSCPETPEYIICDGIVVVPKETVLPNGWTTPE
ncbi:MAG: sugar phosphate nucleotidyltransferase [Planctomycetales bacterium]